MFYDAETCAMPVTTLNHLRCYGRAVVHLICNVKENDKASFFSKSLTFKLWMLHFAKCSIQSLNVKLLEKKLALSFSLTLQIKWTTALPCLGMWRVAMEGLLKYANCTEEIMHPKENLG